VGRDDGTAASLAGACPELAALGYRRDQNPGTAQSVLGVMTMADGEPLAVPVCDGHPAAPLTVPAPVETRSTRGGLTAVVCVGDRGLGKTTGQAALAPAGDQSITALTTPQVRPLRRAGVVRPAWLTPHGHEGPQGSVRRVLRRSAAVPRQAPRRRHDTLATRHAGITARKAGVRPATRAPPAAGRRTRHAWGTRPQLAGWGQWSWPEGALSATVAAAAQTAATFLDGGDV